MSNTYSLVLLGRYPGKDKPVAQALARAFGKDEQWGLPIVGATPINLLTGLSPAQAQAIHAALAEVEQAGSKIQLQAAADESCPTVSWPAEPRIQGRPVGAFGAAGGAPAPSAAGAPLACPHCGKPVQVRLFPPVQAPAEAPQQIPQAGTARPKEPPTPRRASPPVPIPVPVPQQAQAPRPVKPAAPAPAPDGLEELVPIQDFSPSSLTTPPQPMRLPQAPGKVLPEVPVVDSAPFPSAPQLGGPAPAPSQSGPGLGLPVDLEAFEAGLQMGPAPEAPEQTGPPPEHVVPAVKPGKRRRGAPPVDPDALCSIFIGKSRDSRVHELVAEIQGTSVEEAEDLCHKAVVPVVKDIPVREAEEIKQKFQELNVNPRLAVKR